MTFFLTLVDSKKSLTQQFIASIGKIFLRGDLASEAKPNWLSAGKAAAVKLHNRPTSEQLEQLRTALANEKVDFFVTAAKNRQKKLLLADMESTMIEGEMLDELADVMGIGEKVASISARAMKGVLDPILGREAKLDCLKKYATELDLCPDDVLAIGDGANDLAMIEAAGLGIGYRPKPLLQDRIANLIYFNDLRAPLFAQGYVKSEFDK